MSSRDNYQAMVDEIINEFPEAKYNILSIKAIQQIISFKLARPEVFDELIDFIEDVAGDFPKVIVSDDMFGIKFSNYAHDRFKNIIVATQSYNENGEPHYDSLDYIWSDIHGLAFIYVNGIFQDSEHRLKRITEIIEAQGGHLFAGFVVLDISIDPPPENLYCLYRLNPLPAPPKLQNTPFL